LGNDIVRKTVSASAPSSVDFTTDFATQRKGFRNERACALLELEEPLATFACPNITLAAVLGLEFERLLG